RRGRSGASGTGERLLVLREVADQCFGQLVALSDVVETIPRGGHDPDADAALSGALRGAAETFNALAVAIEQERGEPPAEARWSGEALRELLAERTASGDPTGEAARTQYLQAAAGLDRLAQYAALGVANAAALRHGGPAPGVEGIGEVDDEATAPFAQRVLDSVRKDTVMRRYALRVALVAAAAVAAGALLGLERGYWITITAIVILQPYTGLTTQRATQRIAGTMLGGILTAGLGALFHDQPLAILALSFVFCGVCVALLPLNYAVFSIFLTPTFVLLAEASAGDWHLAGVRVANTLIGGVLALAGARLLWPAPEWKRLPAHAAAALRANREHLRRSIARIDDRSPAAGREVRELRRKLGLALMDAEESFQRLIGEHRGDPGELEPMMTLLTYSRRLGGSTGALALARHEARPPAGALEPFSAASTALLDDLAASVEEGRAPAPLPRVLRADAPYAPEAPLPPILRARVERVARQLKTLHDAAERWHGASPLPSSSTPASRAEEEGDRTRTTG
ncbi:MAG TPA: FUSC family protein, partial [Longimicrobium sp.]|nr:FUSC family protein [Longimicrobium sp.]